jgi:hypothetical protein
MIGFEDGGDLIEHGESARLRAHVCVRARERLVGDELPELLGEALHCPARRVELAVRVAAGGQEEQAAPQRPGQCRLVERQLRGSGVAEHGGGLVRPRRGRLELLERLAKLHRRIVTRNRRSRSTVDPLPGRQPKGDDVSLLWIILIVVLVLALLGFFGRGRW